MGFALSKPVTSQQQTRVQQPQPPQMQAPQAPQIQPPQTPQAPQMQPPQVPQAPQAPQMQPPQVPQAPQAPQMQAPQVPAPQVPQASALQAPQTTNVNDNSEKYCIQYTGVKNSRSNPRRSIIYKTLSDNECIPRDGWESTDYIKGFSTQQNNTDKYCYRYYKSGQQTRNILWKAELTGGNCAGRRGWGTNLDDKYGAGGEVYLYNSQQPGSKKVCYKTDNIGYAKTIIYKPDENGNCGENIATDSLIGAGGEFWTSDDLLSLSRSDYK